MTCSERWYCPTCADYSKDREQHLLESTRESIPTCKHCGSECTDSDNDPRVEDIEKLTQELMDAQGEVNRINNARHVLVFQFNKDWYGKT